MKMRQVLLQTTSVLVLRQKDSKGSVYPELFWSPQSFQQSGNILQVIDQTKENQSAKTQSEVALLTIIKALSL